MVFISMNRVIYRLAQQPQWLTSIESIIAILTQITGGFIIEATIKSGRGKGGGELIRYDITVFATGYLIKPVSAAEAMKLLKDGCPTL